MPRVRAARSRRQNRPRARKPGRIGDGGGGPGRKEQHVEDTVSDEPAASGKADRRPGAARGGERRASVTRARRLRASGTPRRRSAAGPKAQHPAGNGADVTSGRREVPQSASAGASTSHRRCGGADLFPSPLGGNITSAAAARSEGRRRAGGGGADQGPSPSARPSAGAAKAARPAPVGEAQEHPLPSLRRSARRPR